MEFWTKGGITGQLLATRAGQVGDPPPDDQAGQISRPAAVGCARIGLAKRRRRPPWVIGHFVIFRPFQAISTHTSLLQFLDHLNSFPWSLFADSSPFESYDENKVGRWLDRVFRPPQQLLDQGNGADEFLVSWAFH